MYTVGATKNKKQDFLIILHHFIAVQIQVKVCVLFIFCKFFNILSSLCPDRKISPPILQSNGCQRKQYILNTNTHFPKNEKSYTPGQKSSTYKLFLFFLQSKLYSNFEHCKRFFSEFQNMSLLSPTSRGQKQLH